MTGYTSGSKSSPPKKRREMRRTMVDFSKKPPGCCIMAPYVWNIFKICFKWRVLKKSNHIVASYFWGKNYDFGCAKEHSPKKLFWKKKMLSLNNYVYIVQGGIHASQQKHKPGPNPCDWVLGARLSLKRKGFTPEVSFDVRCRFLRPETLPRSSQVSNCRSGESLVPNLGWCLSSPRIKDMSTRMSQQVSKWLVNGL